MGEKDAEYRQRKLLKKEIVLKANIQVHVILIVIIFGEVAHTLIPTAR